MVRTIPRHRLNKALPQQGGLIAIVLLAAVLRWPVLTRQSIAFDESFSLVVGLADWPTLFRALLSDGVHPPFFYVIHKSALALYGVSEFGQRFGAAGFSLISIPLVFQSGRIFFNRQVGLLAALLLALNPLHGWLAQEARMYSLLSALTIASMVVFWQAIRTNQRRYWVLLTITNALIFSIHYFGFLVPTIQFVFILLSFQRYHRRLRPWAITQAIAFIPLLPWFVATATREAQTFGIGFLVQPTLLDLGITYWNLTIGSSQFLWLVSGLALLVSGLALVFAFRRMAPHQVWLKQARLLLALWVTLPPLLTWLVSQRRSFYADRYLSFVIPGLVLLLAFGASRVTPPCWRVALMSGLVIASIYGLVLTTYLDPAFQKDDWRAAAGYVAQHEQPHDVVLLYTTHIKFPFDYYYRGHAPTKPISLNLEQFPIDPLTAGHQRAWVVYPYTRRPTHYPMQPLIPNGYWTDDPNRNPNLVQWLAANVNHIIDDQHFRGMQLWLVDLTMP
ncbi:MAG: glycosyltransferase family 39 protein [Anaerolineae bacterium]|nr:glycosyltransferase family 39 protein [Anaerolineae bacterium]